MILVISFIAISLTIYVYNPPPGTNTGESDKPNPPSKTSQEIVPKQKIEELKTKYNKIK